MSAECGRTGRRGSFLAILAAAACATAACASPAAGPAPTAGPTVTAAATPTSAGGSVASTSTAPGELPYTADWRSSLDGWTGSSDWSVSGGELLTSGQSYSNQAGIQAPVDLTGIDGYVVDADIQLVRYTDGGAISGQGSFGIIVRGQDDGSGYGAGVCAASGIFSCANGQNADQIAFLRTADAAGTVLDSRPFRPGQQWHHFRIAVTGNNLSVQIDRSSALSASDNTYVRGGRVGLWANRSQITVRNFQVSASR